MSDSKSTPAPGSVTWRDLTVEDAKSLTAFYRDVVGWDFQPVEMGGYEDYSAILPGAEGEAVAGICHARGSNANLPPQWLIYITVADIEESAAKCVAGGGTVLDGPRSMGEGSVCIIRDPAGAVAALYAPSSD